MGRFDVLSNKYTSTIGLAINANTDFETGVDLMSTARKFVTTYCEEVNHGISFNEESINFFIVDIVAFYCDNNIEFDFRDLAKLFILDRRLYDFALSMFNSNSDFFCIWKDLSESKKSAVLKALEIAGIYFDDL